MFWRKGYIFVSSFAPERLAWVDHSWYHSENDLLFILSVCRSWVERSLALTGMKWALKASWKASHMPKSGGMCASAVCCLSLAHSPVEVPSLKWVRAEAICLLTEEYRSWL